MSDLPKPPRIIKPDADGPYDHRELDRYLQAHNAAVVDLLARIAALEKVKP